MISTYFLAAKTALGAIAGQTAAKNLFTSFGKAQLPSLANAVSYTALSYVGEKATGVDTRYRAFSQKRFLVHLAAALGATYLTPKITQNLFNTNVTNQQSGRMALANFAIHLIPGML